MSEHWTQRGIVPYHERQLEAPYRSTVHLADVIARRCGMIEGSAIDVGCGAGANILYLGQRFPGLDWTGVDIAGEMLFPLARTHLERAGRSATLITGDFHRLRELVGGRTFDLVLSIQTLSFLPEYERALEELLAIARGWLVVSSLFTEFDVDARTTVMDHTAPSGSRGPHHYNVLALAPFRAFCEERGCRAFHAEDFEIDVDLPQRGTGLGTYTRRMADGHRLQFSGPLPMPWKVVVVQMGAGRARPAHRSGIMPAE